MKLRKLSLHNFNFIRQAEIAKANFLKMNIFLGSNQMVALNNVYYSTLFVEQKGETLAKTLGLAITYDVRDKLF